jgi:hypothetical protein
LNLVRKSVCHLVNCLRSKLDAPLNLTLTSNL